MIDFHCDSGREWMERNHNFLLAQTWVILTDVDARLTACLYHDHLNIPSWCIVDKKLLDIYCFLYLALSPSTYIHPILHPHAHHTLHTPVIEPLHTYVYFLPPTTPSFSNFCPPIATPTHPPQTFVCKSISNPDPHKFPPLPPPLQPTNPTAGDPHPLSRLLLLPYMKFTELSQQKLYTLLQKIKSPNPETITATSGRIYTPSTFRDEFFPIIIQWTVYKCCFIYYFFFSFVALVHFLLTPEAKVILNKSLCWLS